MKRTASLAALAIVLASGSVANAQEERPGFERVTISMPDGSRVQRWVPSSSLGRSGTLNGILRSTGRRTGTASDLDHFEHIARDDTRANQGRGGGGPGGSLGEDIGEHDGPNVDGPDVDPTVPLLRPGRGFHRPTPEPGPIGNHGQYGYHAKAVARWDAIPNQRITEESQYGVVAFHANGIKRVAFSLEGGPWTPSESMKVNPRTGVQEYSVRIDPDDFAYAKLVEVRAIAYPNIGQPRLLDSMWIWVDPDNEMVGETAYIATTGSDLTGLGTEAKPFRTIAKGLNAVGKGGEVVIMDEGFHTLEGAGNLGMSDRWTTVRAAEGLERDNVVLGLTGDELELVRLKSDRLRFTGVSFDTGTMRQIYPENDQFIWFDNVRWFDSNGWETVYTPSIINVRTNQYIGGSYYTDSLAEDIMYGFVFAELVRNCHLERISGDVFQNSEMVVNCTVRDVDGDVLEHHTDIFQWFGHFDNLIVFGAEAYDVRKTQNFFLDHNQSSFQNCAFVNVVVENTAGSPPKSQLNSSQTHMLFWHISTPRQPWVFRDDFAGEKQFVADTFEMRNCVFERLSRADYYAEGVPANVRVENCHFGIGEAHGSDPSTGECYIEEEVAGASSGSSFVYNGSDAFDLRQSGNRLPGLLVPAWMFGDGDRPNRGAFPMHR